MSSVYEIVTEKILAALDRGIVPWEKPWVASGKRSVFHHQNYATKHVYTGVNTLLCGASGFACPYWLTYKQAAALGGQVRSGEKGTMITFWKLWERSEGGKEKKIPIFRYFTVFNLTQIDGIEWQVPEGGDIPEGYESQIVERYLEGGPAVRHDHIDRAYYTFASDTVTMPTAEQFPIRERYWQTLYHELAHSTGHSSRLDRKLTGQQGSHYAKEELVAEIASCMMMASAGLEPEVDQSASYIASWKSRISEDPKLIVTAASAAEKAVKLMTEEALVPA